MARALGLDLGAESLRGILLERTKDTVRLVTAGATPLEATVLADEGQDRQRVVAEKLKELVRGARLDAPVRRVCLTSKSTSLRHLTVPPMPHWRLELLAKYEATEHGEEKAAVAYDYRILDVGASNEQYCVLLGACPEATLEWTLRTCRQAKLGLVEVDLKPLALYNAYVFGHGADHEKTALVVDIGAETTTVALVHKCSLYQARSFEGGAQRFTQVLADALHLNPLEAEDVKKNEGEIRFDLLATAGARRAGRLGRPGGAAGPRADGQAGATAGPEAEAAAAEQTPDSVAMPEAAETGQSQTETATAGDVPTAAAAPPPSSVAPISLPAEDQTTLGAQAAETLAAATGGEGNGAGKEAGAERRAAAERRRRQINAALVREAAALCALIENTLNSCRSLTKLRELKLDVVYLAGGGGKLSGLAEYMSRRLRAPVEPLDVFRRVALDGLAPETAEALRAERHTMALATGMALSALYPGTVRFSLLAVATKERRVFWAREAYLYYAAALLIGALALFFYKPSHDRTILEDTKTLAMQAIEQAQTEQAQLDDLAGEIQELRQRLQQMEKNAASGEYFNEILMKLKHPDFLPHDIYLCSIQTSVPPVVPGGLPTAEGSRDGDSFQARSRVYLRGFVRNSVRKNLEAMILNKEDGSGLCRLLVKHPEVPDHEDNLFREVQVVWIDPDDNGVGAGPQFWLKEFVLEAVVKEARTETSKPPVPKAAPKVLPTVENY